MKKTICLVLLIFSYLTGLSQVTQSQLLEQADTCKDPNSLKDWATTISRNNAQSDAHISHMALGIALDRISTNDSAVYSRLLNEHGILHAIRKEPDSAIVYYSLAIDHAPKSDSSQIGYIYRNLGVALDMLERFDDALEAAYTALRYLPIDDSLYRPLTYLEISKHLYRISNHDLSVTYAERAAAYFKATERWYDYGSALNSLGVALLHSDTNSRRSIRVLHEALSINKQAGNILSAAQKSINLGIAHYQLGDLDSAMFFLELSLDREDFDEIYNDRSKAILWTNLATVLLTRGEHEECEKYIDLAYPVVTNNDLKFVHQRLAHTQYKLALAQRDTPTALHYLQDYVRLYQTNNTITNKSKLLSVEQDVNERLRIRENELLAMEMEMAQNQHESESKILYTGMGILIVVTVLVLQLNRLVRKRRKETALSLVRLNELDMAKNRLFSIIGHDLRGPIGNSLFLLKELPQQGDKLTSDSSAVLENVEQGLTEVHGLLENLLIWARDQAKDLEWRKSKVDVSSVAHQCIQLLNVLLPSRRMKLETSVASELNWTVDPNAYSTILRNLISNSLKYAPEGTTVSCSIYVDSDQLITRICDEGPGVPAEIVKDLEELDSLRGASRGMGLKLVKIIILEHKGTLHFFQSKEEGFCVEVRLPS